jgi:hypothetical protein
MYIDKDKWEDETILFKAANDLDYTSCHDFICYNNVVSLEHDSNDMTICKLDNLVKHINKKITKEYNAIILVDFDITLEFIFLNLINIAKSNNIDIYILNKSDFALRSNVSMTIDLDEYDTNTEFDSVRNILESNLNDSLENAKKSKKPEHANDLGIFLSEEQTNSLSTMFKALGLDDFIEEYEDLEEEYEDLDENEINDLLKALLNDEEVKTSDDNDNTKLSFKIEDDILEISNTKNIIKIDKTAAKKLMKILEVLIDD